MEGQEEGSEGPRMGREDADDEKMKNMMLMQEWRWRCVEDSDDTIMMEQW